MANKHDFVDILLFFFYRWTDRIKVFTYLAQILMGRYNHSLSLDATIMISKNCPIVGEHVVIIFVTQ